MWPLIMAIYWCLVSSRETKMKYIVYSLVIFVYTDIVRSDTTVQFCVKQKNMLLKPTSTGNMHVSAKGLIPQFRDFFLADASLPFLCRHFLQTLARHRNARNSVILPRTHRRNLIEPLFRILVVPLTATSHNLSHMAYPCCARIYRF